VELGIGPVIEVAAIRTRPKLNGSRAALFRPHSIAHRAWSAAGHARFRYQWRR
jgi:hypothetical protein